jgi:hypothetical protein
MKLMGAVVLACCFGAPTAQAESQGLKLKEHLGRTWTNELVRFPISSQQGKKAANGLALIGPGGREIAYQLTGDKTKNRICLQADLTPYATSEYRFSDKPAAAKSDLKITESADQIRISNKHTGLTIARKLSGSQGPIASIRLRSGLWTGGSSLSKGDAIASYDAKVTARGPVFVEIICKAVFADKGEWTLRCRLESNEPVIIVDEQFDTPSGGVFSVSLGDKTFQPANILFRSGNMSGFGRVMSNPTPDKGLAFTLEPWLHWWEAQRQGNWFALYSETDMLMVGLLKPSLWKDPGWKGSAPQAPPRVKATVANKVTVLQFPLSGGRRRWMLGVPDKAQSIKPLSEKNRNVSPPPQDYLIKHGDFPLDEVKDYVLEWDGDHENYPRLFLGKEDLTGLRKLLKPDRRESARRILQRPINKYDIETPIHEYFASGDAGLGKRIIETSDNWLDKVVDDDLLDQNRRVTLGVAPHMQAVLMLPAINLTDAAMSCKSMTPRLRKRFLARLAFLGYTLNRDDYWSPRRGFSANPNMTTTVAHYQTAIASLIPSHPKAKQWAAKGLNQLRYQLNSWSDEDGGWLEAPHYAMVSYDHMLASFIMAARAGFGDYLYEDRMRKVVEWFAKISTPRDVRTSGFRHHPPIGNTYHGEGTGLFGIVAGLWKQRDPQFAANMQWMHREHGSSNLGIGWSFPSLAGYKTLLRNYEGKPKPPTFGSTWFRKTGVVLRNVMGSERETYLHLIAGPNHDHYDYDSGSIVLWGKGRVLADDWGYIGRHARKYHSLLSSKTAGGNMRIKEFAAQTPLDYVSGLKGSWRRQIAFAKDTDPNGPNFFLIRDTHNADEGATWRLWLTTEADIDGDRKDKPKSGSAIRIHARGATVSGPDDVDLDIFMYRAGKLKLQTETASQKLSCANRKGKVGPTSIQQTALIASLEKRDAVVSLLYPRLKTEKSPKVTWSADGRIAKVVSQAGVDYVFLAPEAVKAEFDQVAFQGSAGLVQIRGKRTLLTLGAGGEIRLGARELTSDKPKTQTNTTP